jgi:Protein of unknown function (DUF1588)/Protein of unknown function (DUF1592)/Protein of unknown function (DUF1595)/Protein of unknown function (DUF1587)
MKSTPVRFSRPRTLGLAVSMATLVGAQVACTGVGSIQGGPGSAQTGSGGTTTTGGAGTGIGAGGAGGVKAIDPAGPVSSNVSWYDTFKTVDCSGAPSALPATRIWRLSALQWQNTVASALGVSSPDVSAFPPDQSDPRTGYSDDSTGDKITLPLAQSYFDKSDTVATQAATAALTAVPCLAATPMTAACQQMFVSSYGAKLFRRALTTAETTGYTTFLAGELKADPAPQAVASTFKAMLLSPNFLFRTELGTSKPGPVDLTTDEIASLLSYSIADMPPDAALQAVSAQLGDPTVRTAQAERLAALPAAKAKLNDFWTEYLALGNQPTTPGIDQSAWNEASTFFSKVVWDGNGTLKDLLTAPYTYADTTVAAVYGSAKPDATGKLTLDPTQRAGFLTSIAMLSQTSAPSQAATVIHRGLLVRERVLCQIPPPPPATVVPDPAKIQAITNGTARQNYVQFTMDHMDCNACHSFFQPLGLAFEAYDANGKFRTQYPAPISMPIDTTGTLNAAGDATGDYADVVGMATKLGGSQMAQYCLSQQFAEYALGRTVSLDQEACTVRSMGDYVTSKGGQVHTLLASFAAAPTVSRRFHQ